VEWAAQRMGMSHAGSKIDIVLNVTICAVQRHEFALQKHLLI
jgi:hypothetical protein